MRRRGVRVRVLPHTTSAAVALASRRRRRHPVARPRRSGAARRPRWRWREAIIADGRPLLGICLGHQIVGARGRRRDDAGSGSATTARTTRSGTSSSGSSRSPPRTTRSRSSAPSLPAAVGFRVSQVNLNDGSVEGLRHRELPIETVQYHPEGAPGPLDALAVFDRFVAAAGRRPMTGRSSVSRCRGREARLGPDHRVRAGRHRPGRRVRLRRARRPAARCAPRASGRSSSTPTRPRS